MASVDIEPQLLPAPAVPAEVYDKDYYGSVCLGSDEWTATRGQRVHPIYPALVEMAGIGRGETVIDVGCGRGELLIEATDAGADRAVGIEYSAAAVELTQETISAHEAGDGCEVILSDARAMPLPAESADCVTMIDVVEHLTREELGTALTEAKRVLRPGGRLFIHTAPNRFIYSVTYRLQRLILPWRIFTWPSNPRNNHENLMHVNEQTVHDLRVTLQAAGFGGVRVWLGNWVPNHFQPRARHARIYRTLARLGPLAHFGIADIFAAAKRPA